MTAKKVTKENIYVKIIESRKKTENPMNSTEDIIRWLEEMNQKVSVQIRNIPYSLDGFWYYDRVELGLVNRKRSFFSIKGVEYQDGNGVHQQPMIIPDDIGYLGLLCKVIDGTLYFLMQVKCEPGNVRPIQLAPTVQTTKSAMKNASSMPFLSYFLNPEKYMVLTDRIQSEHGTRFLGKKNRNMILLVQDDLEMPSSFRWLTLGQIHELLCRNNLVNMDARAVLSCLPYTPSFFTASDYRRIKPLFSSEAFYQSMFHGRPDENIRKLSVCMNDLRMSCSPVKITDLNSLTGWSMKNGIYSSEHSSFRIDYCDIQIAGKNAWQQPMLRPSGRAVYGLMYRINARNIVECIVHVMQVPGYADQVEVGVSVQKDARERKLKNDVEKVFYSHVHSGKGVIHSALFSQEGGRFYHNENWNVLVQIDPDELKELPDGYFYVDFETLHQLIQWSDCLSIHLRGLMLMMEM